MVMKCFEVEFSELAKEQSFRFDVDFIAFQSNFLVGNYYSFNRLFDFSTNDSVDVEAFFRTTYFQVLIEINKKGLGNNTNIFPSQIREFPIIDIPLTRQQKIVDEIKLELDLQEQIKKQIEAERKKIDAIIEQAILNRK